MVAAAFAAACSDTAPDPVPVAPPALESVSDLPGDVPLTADLPASPDSAIAWSEPPPTANVPASRKPLRARTRGESPVVTAESHVPLESLLRAPTASSPPPKSPLDLRDPSPDPGATPLPPPFGGLDRWKNRVHVERHTEPIGPSGARQGTVSQTDAALRVPVDDSISLEGGVRVDSRDEPGRKEPERSSTPRVGVEVTF